MKHAVKRKRDAIRKGKWEKDGGRRERGGRGEGGRGGGGGRGGEGGGGKREKAAQRTLGFRFHPTYLLIL